MGLEYLTRFFAFLDQAEQDKITSASVLLFGVGGVGSAVAQLLVRSGIQNLTIVDFDKIDVTNINRQLVANSENVGKLKVDELEKQLKQINPQLNLNKFPLRLDATTINNFNLTQYTVVVDCIDDVRAKKFLIKAINNLSSPPYLLCAMGAGNRYKDIPNFVISDISKTSYDPLSKIIRKFCASEGVKHIDVCYTTTPPVKINADFVGSVAYYPISMACVIACRVINEVIERPISDCKS